MITKIGFGLLAAAAAADEAAIPMTKKKRQLCGTVGGATAGALTASILAEKLPGWQGKALAAGGVALGGLLGYGGGTHYANSHPELTKVGMTTLIDELQNPNMRLLRLKNAPMGKQRYATYLNKDNDPAYDAYVQKFYPGYQPVTDIPRFRNELSAFLAQPVSSAGTMAGA